MKGGGGAKQNASLEQGAQVSTATQRATTTTKAEETLSNRYTHKSQSRRREGGGANYCSDA